MTSPKADYLRKVHDPAIHQTSVKFHDFERPPSFYTEEREHAFHARVLHDMFAGKIDMSIGQWSDYLQHVASDPQHSYAIPGRQTKTDEPFLPNFEQERPYLLALLAGQASGKSALKTVMENNGTLDPSKAVTVSTSFFLNRFPELQNLEGIDARENALASVRNEILYLQRLVANVALANGVSVIEDVHIIEEKQAQELTDIARKNHAPSILIAPHVSLETYARRVAARQKKEGRDAFKPEHVLFHQIFADNFEHHFKHMFDMSLVLDNNRDITAEVVAKDPSAQSLTPIYRALRMEDGSADEKVMDAKAYQQFKDKVYIQPAAVQVEIERLSRRGSNDEQAEAIERYLTAVSKQLSREGKKHAGSTPAEREGAEQEFGKHHGSHVERFLKLQTPEGWKRGG
jgi:hypothetical protein